MLFTAHIKKVTYIFCRLLMLPVGNPAIGVDFIDREKEIMLFMQEIVIMNLKE